jgi:glutathione synthase/RimK-type ligase-like ATP-grasp enzyme
MVFDQARWMNHPRATYLAEHKAFQLRVADDLGFAVPETLVTNSQRYLKDWMPPDASVAVKGLDTVLVRTEATETFGFTTFSTLGALDREEFREAPVVVQRAVTEKLDIRVTVVAQQVFAAEITGREGPIDGDWRTLKDQARFSSHSLPKVIHDRCIELVMSLGLEFGAIDLALADRQYWFLEINPTGEWGWLVDTAGLPIDAAIADWLGETS